MSGLIKHLLSWALSTLKSLFRADDWDDEAGGDTATRMLYRRSQARKAANENR